MRLYPLSSQTREAAIYHADVHLRPSVINAAKIMSDAVHFAVARQLPPCEGMVINKAPSLKNESEYWLGKTKLMPPSKSPSVWSTWAADNQFNAWWVIDHAWQLQNEYFLRFGEKEILPEYQKTQTWVMGGIMRCFPKPTSTKIMDDFPLVLPPAEIIALGDTTKMSVIDIYRGFYAAQRGRVRMRWTKRTRPAFMAYDDIDFAALSK